MENEQTNELNNWLKEEKKNLEESRPQIDEHPSLKFEENKIVEFTVEYDINVPFPKWCDPNPDKNLVKKIIPVLHNGEKKNLWLNIKNPLYHLIVDKLLDGQTTFKVVQTGTQDKTKYTLVDEEGSRD